jgi:hypothetical protein
MELSLIDPGLGLLRRLRRMLIAHREIRGLGYAGKTVRILRRNRSFHF